MNIRYNHNKKAVRGVFFAAVALLAGTQGARAQAVSQDSLQARIDELDQQIRVVARLNEIAQEDAKAAAAKAPKISAGEGGFGIASADGAYSIKFRAFAQVQALDFLSNSTPFTNTLVTPNVTSNVETPGAFSIKRLQPDVGGSLGKQLDYRVHFNVASGTVDPLDVNLDWKILPEFSVRLGKFKAPTGLERLISSPRAPFIEGSFVTALQPNRDIGVQLFGSFKDGLLEYQAGLFDGARDGQSLTTDNNKDKDLYVRVFSQPFSKSGIELLEGFGIGISGSRGHHGDYNNVATSATVVRATNDTTNTPAGGSNKPLVGVTTVAAVSNGITSYGTGRQTVFTYASNDTSEGTLSRWSPQASWYYGPFGLIAEYTQTTQNVRRATFDKDLTNSAWAVTGSWFITGEKNAYKSIKVKKANTFPTLDGIGAIELLGRVHALKIDGSTFDSLSTDRRVRLADPSRQVSKATGYGAAAKWYLNSNVVLFGAYEYTKFTGGAGTAATASVNPIVADRTAEQVLSASVNVSF
ncbi:MAG TPA: porin [Fibrobacteria bacterium]|jgi:phosphate-selective porin OprO/OprP|nr:porin [Fibrobacteria bacterium]